MRTTTDRMKMAIALVAGGATGYRAGRTAGISPQALYKNESYKVLMEARRASGAKVRPYYPPKTKPRR